MKMHTNTCYNNKNMYYKYMYYKAECCKTSIACCNLKHANLSLKLFTHGLSPFRIGLYDTIFIYGIIQFRLKTVLALVGIHVYTETKKKWLIQGNSSWQNNGH